MEHLAVIMDGNRRWAKTGKGSSEDRFGHKKGKDAARLVVEFCIKKNIKYLSLYTFSIENLNRSEEEKNDIFSILLMGIESELEDLIKEGVRIRFIGDRTKFPKHLIPSITKAEAKTESQCVLNLNILFCYGAQQEYVHVVRSLAQRVKAGDLNVEDIDHEMVENALWTAGIPNPDLILRTSGISRLSNFLLYQAAYSELAFLDCYWPEITEAHLTKCVEDFKNTKQNFGY